MQDNLQNQLLCLPEKDPGLDSPLEYLERRAGGYAGEVVLEADQHHRGHRHWKNGVPSTYPGMYLGVCNLLNQFAALPAELLPGFQMCRWAFVSEG